MCAEHLVFQPLALLGIGVAAPGKYDTHLEHAIREWYFFSHRSGSRSQSWVAPLLLHIFHRDKHTEYASQKTNGAPPSIAGYLS